MTDETQVSISEMWLQGFTLFDISIITGVSLKNVELYLKYDGRDLTDNVSESDDFPDELLYTA